MLNFALVLVAYVSVAAVLLFAGSEAFLAMRYRKSKEQPPVKPAHGEWQGPLPRVLLQLPIYNEQYVVERLLQQVAKADYPKDLLTIQLLDDSTDETTAIAAEAIKRLGAAGTNIHHVRRADRSGYKAGAMKAGLELNDSEFVVIFDADFLPQPDFIKRVLPYFTDPKIGMVQTRWEHLNADYSLATRLLSFGIDNHFSVEQGGRQANGSFINFNGTAGMWRRKTIDEAGGWSSDSLTEDLDLSFRAQLKGWKFLFVEDISTPQELPVQMTAIRSQQFRWTKGAAEAARKSLGQLWGSSEPLTHKVIGSFHMMNSMVFMFVLALSLALVAMTFTAAGPDVAALLPIKVMLTISVLGLVYTYWTSQKMGELAQGVTSSLGILVTAVLFVGLVSGLSLMNGLAVLQGLIGKVTPFVRTPKLAVNKKGQAIASKKAYNLSGISPLYVAEVLLAARVVVAAIVSIFRGNYILIDVYAFFAFGYAVVSWLTLSEVLGINTDSGKP
jgi:cellulose synthase/poly-beta-1,6-N-acetylglucosamine synthase-like glycosyltransferase